VLKPSSGVGVSLEQRVVALGLADQGHSAFRVSCPARLAVAPGWTVTSAR